MGYLDETPKRFTPPQGKKFKAEDNFEKLQNDGHETVAEDFSDSPFADRKELLDEE